MCGRFTLTSTPEELARRFGLEEPPRERPRYNIAPGQPVLAVREEAGRRAAAHLRWGLVPGWAEGPGVGAGWINARAETLADRPAFREAFRMRRCLVPADGFYEWARSGDGAARPYRIALRDAAPFGLAGLWERWRDPQGGWLESCAIVTTEASPRIRHIHPRMPVILAPAAFASWLDTRLRDPAALEPLLAPSADLALCFHPVGLRVNSTRFDDPACAMPVPEPPRQESLF